MKRVNAGERAGSTYLFGNPNVVPAIAAAASEPLSAVGLAKQILSTSPKQPPTKKVRGGNKALFDWLGVPKTQAPKTKPLVPTTDKVKKPQANAPTPPPPAYNDRTGAYSQPPMQSLPGLPGAAHIRP